MTLIRTYEHGLTKVDSDLVDNCIQLMLSNRENCLIAKEVISNNIYFVETPTEHDIWKVREYIWWKTLENMMRDENLPAVIDDLAWDTFVSEREGYLRYAVVKVVPPVSTLHHKLKVKLYTTYFSDKCPFEEDHFMERDGFTELSFSVLCDKLTGQFAIDYWNFVKFARKKGNVYMECIMETAMEVAHKKLIV